MGEYMGSLKAFEIPQNLSTISGEICSFLY